MTEPISFTFVEKNSPFNYLRIYSMAPDLIDWKRFNYPSISVRRYNERNGQNEIEEIVKVYVTVPSILKVPSDGNGGMFVDVTLYRGTASPREWSGVVSEVYTFNTNPEKYWKMLLIPLMEQTLEVSKESRKKAKRREKKIRKGLDRLKGLDIRYVG